MSGGGAGAVGLRGSRAAPRRRAGGPEPGEFGGE